MSSKNATTEAEIWKDIPGYPGYQVSDHGQVRSFWVKVHSYRSSLAQIQGTPKKVLRPGKGSNGYLKVSLCSQGRKVSHWIHRLVLETFIGPRPHGMETCHNDGNRLNNCLKNLRWDSRTNNQRDRTSHGRDPVGEQHPNSIFTESKVREIRNIYSNGCISQRELAKIYDVHQTTIGAIITRRNWKHVV